MFLAARARASLLKRILVRSSVRADARETASGAWFPHRAAALSRAHPLRASCSPREMSSMSASASASSSAPSADKRARVEEGGVAPVAGAPFPWVVKPAAALVSTRVEGKAVRPDGVDVVLYHGPHCPDGFGAALAAWLRLGDACRYVPVDHGPKVALPEGLEGKRVVVLDFAFSEPLTRALRERCAALLVLDHHASAEAALAGLPAENKVFEMRQSGATLAWDFFHGAGSGSPLGADAPGRLACAAGDATPLLFRYLEDRDIWRWAMHESEAWCCGFDMLDKSFEAWRAVLEAGERGAHALVESGRAIVAYKRKTRDSHVKRARPTRLRAAPELTGLIVNGSTLASDIGNALCQVRLPPPPPAAEAEAAPAPAAAAAAAAARGTPGGLAAYGMIWEYEHATKVFRVSLRSDCDEVDVSLIAKKFGGGGHRRAAGFSHTGASIEELLLDVEAPQGWKAEPAGAANV
jgi:hypothetical protein